MGEPVGCSTREASSFALCRLLKPFRKIRYDAVNAGGSTLQPQRRVSRFDALRAKQAANFPRLRFKFESNAKKDD
jgi:hypothetical protein